MSKHLSCSHAVLISQRIEWLFSVIICSAAVIQGRDVGRSEIWEGRVVIGGHNLHPLVEIGLTDLF